MKCSLALILFIAVSSCESNRLVCGIFDSNKRSLQQYCYHYNKILPENCSSDIISTNESPQVNFLKIGGCGPEMVLDLAKRFQQDLRALDISHSGLKSLESFDLTFNQSQIFNASHNELSYLSWNFFLQFPEINEIDLSHNNLHSTYFGLMKLPKLRKLHLSHNNITYVNIKSFPLQSIEYIDLSSNHIEYLLAVPYMEYKSLEEFHLENNPIKKVDSDLLLGMFHGRLTSLFITWKNVEKFWGLCMDDCQEKRMHIVRIDDTSEGIFITSNGRYEMHCRDKCFENVHSLVAGRNNFQNGNDVIQNTGSSVECIDLNGNFVGELSASAFDRFAKMYRLELSGTNLTWFDFDMLWNQKNIIQYIDISNNDLKELHNIPSLRNYINLQELSIRGNRIENAYEIAEYLNPSMEDLDLSGGNIVGKVNVTTFQRLVGLQRLNLSNTNLILSDSNPFEMLQDLKVLDLSHNNLENFNFSILSAALYNLTELVLTDCKIKNIMTIMEYLGPNLLKLDLSKNSAHGGVDSLYFDLNSLKFQQKLQFLDISNNKLKTVNFKSTPFDNHIHINLEGNDLIELTNLQNRHPDSSWTTLKLTNNQFPCLYLKQLKKDFDTEIYLADDSWQQKPDRDCRTSTESIKGFVANVYDAIKFW